MALRIQQVLFNRGLEAAAAKVAANNAANEKAKQRAALQRAAGQGKKLSSAELRLAYDPALDARGKVRT